MAHHVAVDHHNHLEGVNKTGIEVLVVLVSMIFVTLAIFLVIALSMS